MNLTTIDAKAIQLAAPSLSSLPLLIRRRLFVEETTTVKIIITSFFKHYPRILILKAFSTLFENYKKKFHWCERSEPCKFKKARFFGFLSARYSMRRLLCAHAFLRERFSTRTLFYAHAFLRAHISTSAIVSVIGVPCMLKIRTIWMFLKHCVERLLSHAFSSSHSKRTFRLESWLYLRKKQ